MLLRDFKLWCLRKYMCLFAQHLIIEDHNHKELKKTVYFHFFGDKHTEMQYSPNDYTGYGKKGNKTRKELMM